MNTLNKETCNIEIGQRIYSGLYGRRNGIVYAIHGKQAPASVGSLSGIVQHGGSAEFDIVFGNGSISRRLPECILRGVQWEIYDDIATQEEIAEAIRNAEYVEAEKDTQIKKDNERRIQEREDYRRNNQHLTTKEQKPDFSPGRLAAANMRKELKKSFPGIKFSVRSTFNKVTVNWNDGPIVADVEKICGRYQAGHFDGMIDCYERDNDNTFSDVFGDPRYVFCGRNISGNKREKIKKLFCERREICPTEHLDYSQEHSFNAIINRTDFRQGGEIIDLDFIDGQETVIFADASESASETDGTPGRPPALAPASESSAECSGVTTQEDSAHDPRESDATTQEQSCHVEKHYHTKRGYDFWVVVMDKKLDRQSFEYLRSLCKDAGGWYSRKWGTTPGGFAFDVEADAERWAGERNKLYAEVHSLDDAPLTSKIEPKEITEIEQAVIDLRGSQAGEDHLQWLQSFIDMPNLGGQEQQAVVTLLTACWGSQAGTARDAIREA